MEDALLFEGRGSPMTKEQCEKVTMSINNVPKLATYSSSMMDMTLSNEAYIEIRKLLWNSSCELDLKSNQFSDSYKREVQERFKQLNFHVDTRSIVGSKTLLIDTLYEAELHAYFPQGYAAVQFLIQLGADFTIKDASGNSAVQIAKRINKQSWLEVQ